ncbi:MAG: FAD-dependent oxidoreductase [Deltaproteobacteria bacterium]|jgi:succinate dehydrogenase/fumarate reductase flavoprotein subunit|nr:FAD-dependent oxidoreductase [Deltaproteobacteria bacterium]
MINFNTPLQTDVLVVGGGIGGLCAAIAAARGGAAVMVLEKADTRRSGSGATGNDHFACYDPETHGPDMAPILQEYKDSMVGLCLENSLAVRFLERSREIVDLWHSWGINMKPFGDKYVFMGHAYPGRPRIWLKYDGHNQKGALTRQALQAGVKILNHHPTLDLVPGRDGVAGALALNMSRPEPSFTVIQAKKVILATGSATRLYPSAASPGWPFNTAFCPACTGAAQAQSWRIGGRLVNMELPNRHAGPKFFARAGKSTWIGVYRYPDGRLIGPFVSKATREVGDITCDVWNSAYTDLLMNGTGPAYLDCSGSSGEDLAFMREGMISEGLTGLLDYMDKRGIDPAGDAVEFMQYEPHLIGRGLDIGLDGQTSVPGLYAAGDMVGNVRADIAGAAVYGWITGESAARAARGSLCQEAGPPWVKERAGFYSQFAERRQGAHWKEAGLALQQIMDSYAAAGPHRKRSATLLNAGIKYLNDLRADAAREIRTDNAHELLRAAEIFDLMDNGAAIMHAAKERQESRGMHLRADFPFTNPLLADQFLTVRQEANRVVTEWRKKR